MTTWLITGGCGFIGTTLIKNILAQDESACIRVLDNLSVGTTDDLGEVCEFELISSFTVPDPKGIQLVVGDIRDTELLDRVTVGIGCIVHLAANTGVPNSVASPRLDFELNVIGTYNVLEAARNNNIDKVIFASSNAPLGEVEPPVHENIAPRPISPYGSSKLSGEAYCSSFYRSFGLKTIALRFGNVYGPRSKNKSSVVAKFIKAAFDGEVCEIYGDGNQTRDFIYIDDLTGAIIKASTADVGGEVFQIASAKEHTINELVEILESRLIEIADIKMAIEFGEVRLGDIVRNYSDTSKAKEMLDWTANTTLADGIDQTISYFLELNK